MNPYNVVFLIISTELGGAERSLLDILKHYTLTKNHNIAVISPQSTGPLLDEIRLLNIPILTLNAPPLFLKTSRTQLRSLFRLFTLGSPAFLIYAYKFIKTLRAHPSLVIHSTGLKNHILLCVGSFFLKSKIIIHIRDFITNPILLSFFRLFKNKKNLYWITTSDAVSINLHIPTQTFYSGFDTQKFFKNKQSQLKEQLKISPSIFLVGHVAALSPWKGQVEFLKAAHQVLQQNSNYHFAVIGSQIYTTQHKNDYPKQLIKLTQELGIQNHVSFLEFQKDIASTYNNLDLLVHTSIHPEPFGRVIAEALFCETPVIASCYGGTQEIFPPHSETYLVDPRNTQALAQKMIDVSLNPQVKHDILKIHQYVKEKFDYKICFEKLVNYINDPFRQ